MHMLTMFADYRVPQLLRDAGVMVYSDHLAALVDAGAELLAGSEEETQIRHSFFILFRCCIADSIVQVWHCPRSRATDPSTQRKGSPQPACIPAVVQSSSVHLVYCREASSSVFRWIGCYGKRAKASASLCYRTIARRRFFTRKLAARLVAARSFARCSKMHALMCYLASSYAHRRAFIITGPLPLFPRAELAEALVPAWARSKARCVDGAARRVNQS